MKTIAGRMTRSAQTIAIPKLMMREMIHFPDVRSDVPARSARPGDPGGRTGCCATGIAEGYLRPVDPDLTIRSIIGPIMLHVLMAEVFGILPADGLAIERLVDNHLTILFDGLSAPAERQAASCRA